MKYGLIGCGRIASKHVEAALENSLEIVAICDISLDNARKLIKSFEKLQEVLVYDDFEKMLLEVKLDLVAIATPNNTHTDIAIRCIENGVHVIIEKPFATSMYDFNRLIEIKNKNYVKISVCHQNRFNNSISKLKSFIEKGNLGKINLISAKVFWYRDDAYYQQSSWRGTKEHLDGALLNQSIHNLDLLMWLMDSEIKEIKSITRNFLHPQIEMEDFGAAIIEFVSGSIGIFEATTAAFPSNLEESLYVFAEKGTIKIGGKSLNILENWNVEDDSEDINKNKLLFSENPSSIYGNGHSLLYKDMLNSIEGDHDPLISIEEASKSLLLIFKIYGLI